MSDFRSVFAALLLAVSGGGDASAEAPVERVVSLDFCADQYILKLLPADHILALSPDAERDFSYMRESATGINTVRPVAEDVLTLGPGIIVRSYGGGPNAVRFFERAGIPVVQVPYADDIVGVKDTIIYLAERFGVPEQGEQLVADMDRRLQLLQTTDHSTTALYMTPTGVTSGSGTMVHEMLRTAGLDNYQQLPGWRSLPLERLAYAQPDIVAAAFFDSKTDHPSMWSPMRHPVAKRQISERPTVPIQGAWTACGGWFLLDAIESLNAVAVSGALK